LKYSSAGLLSYSDLSFEKGSLLRVHSNLTTPVPDRIRRQKWFANERNEKNEKTKNSLRPLKLLRIAIYIAKF